MVKNKQLKKIAVIGIGRVGLPLALVLADQNYFVYGIGRTKEKINDINKGKMPFLEKGALNLLKKTLHKTFICTTDYSEIKNCDYIIMTLGTPVDENMNPLLNQINESLESAMPYFKTGQTLILRSTVSPKTTLYVASLLEDSGKLKIGKNFFLAFCPERISEGKSIEEITTIPQIIGGVDPKSALKAKELFTSIKVETLITDSTSAELAKLFTNMYRYINFAISNEFMVLANNYGKNIHEIVNLVNYKYKRGGLSLPGLTGGPCLFKDGFFLIADIPYAELISTSWKINESIPLFLIKLIKEKIELKHKRVALLGMSFKSEIDDIRESLSFKIRNSLLRERAIIKMHDPYVKSYKNQIIENNVYESFKMADLIIVATNHAMYRKLDIAKIKFLAKKNCYVCDVWNNFNTNKVIFKLKDLSS